MRALLISGNDETKELLGKFVRTHFPKIFFNAVSDDQQAVEDITNQGDIEVIFIDVDDKSLEPREVADKLTDIVGEIPKVFLGNKNNINSRAYINIDVIEEKDDELALAMPIVLDEFKELMTSIISKVEEENFANSIMDALDDDFLPLKVRNFYLYDTIPYDSYIRLTKEKYALILQQGKSYSHSFIHNYVKKQVRYFYMSKDDHIKALEALMATVARDLHSQKRMETEKLVSFHVQGISLIQEYLRLIGISDQVVLMTKIVIESTLRLFKKIKTEKDLLRYINFASLDSGEKSLLTFKICDTIIKAMNWEADFTKMKLGLASIIHDCTIPNEDMFKISDLEDPNLSFFEEEEQRLFKSHPQDAAKLASYFNDIPEVDFIISQHHEMPDGSGFPNRLNGHTLTSLSAIFILSNNFVSELYRTNVNKEGLKNITHKFKKYDRGNFKEPYKILLDIIRYNIL